MAKKHFGLVIFGCAVVVILRGQGVASAPVQGEAASVESNQITDLEEQLKQQSGENKSSQPAVMSVDQGDAESQDVPAEDALADDVQATGLSSDYYGVPSSEDTIDATQPERAHEVTNDEGKPAAAAKEENANSDGKSLDEQVYNGRDKEGMVINLEEQSFQDDAEEVENHEKNRENLNEDDTEQIERPWKEESDMESQEAPPNGFATELAKLNYGDAEEEIKEEEQEQSKENEYEQKTTDDRKKLEQQRYEEYGKENTDETLDSRLLIEREKKTYQGRTLAANLDKSGRPKDGERLTYNDDFAGYV